MELLATDSYQQYVERFGLSNAFKGFRCLFILPSEKRLANVRQLGGQVAAPHPSAKRFIWLTTRASVTPMTILGPIWRSLDPTDLRAYALGGAA